ncbi:MAG: hypothetical protein P4L81_05260 [Candidatus Pacebacteria bacterium]|nr:hypothetical protein [Candidatus Paceibacterota bacterium]
MNKLVSFLFLASVSFGIGTAISSFADASKEIIVNRALKTDRLLLPNTGPQSVDRTHKSDKLKVIKPRSMIDNRWRPTSETGPCPTKTWEQDPLKQTFPGRCFA